MNVKDKSIAGPKMNSTSLYVTTTQIILKADPKNSNSWQDLYRLIPYLRNSLCCVVCSNLLVNPYSPTIAQCQHHICKLCKGGRKKIKPACEGCRDCVDYSENKRLRILLQCYKKMCSSLISSPLLKCISMQESELGTGFERGASNLLSLIKEGALFEDDYKSNGGLPKSTYSILPCIYTNTQSKPNNEKAIVLTPNIQRSSFYSVLYPGNGSKITLKRKTKEASGTVSKALVTNSRPKELSEKTLFKKPCTVKPKKGCRCGNATATPGKLTCCGQRCPCYVDSKPCIECKCRGCRNPHIKEGQKMIPHIPDIQIQLPTVTTTTTLSNQPQVSSSKISNIKIEDIDLDEQFGSFGRIGVAEHFKSFDFVGGYNVPLSADILPVVCNEDNAEMNIM
ncbi:E3 ubiquitin-protein ligase MSL2 [Diorhabda carinulata]|uniref:E3 ubiquitin-protein ligase MSL2 n=1 Tax=Diorhabda carinulata TaxID=1163345 RepID=UPI0025A2D80D|nr:E3 ubiquitin-protein ligase MSL2 [Diorhabda carinulata]